MEKNALIVLNREFCIHRFGADARIPSAVLESRFFWIGRTDEELSIVCESAIRLDSDHCQVGWACLKAEGPIDFAVTGVLSDISRVLASAKISIFVLSTYDTDYILLEKRHVPRAQTLLRKAGYEVRKQLR